MNTNITDQAETHTAARPGSAHHVIRSFLSLTLALAGATTVLAAEPAKLAAAPGLPPVIKIVVIKEITGSAGFAGASAKKGIELAVDMVNASHYLGQNTRLQLEVKDTASVTQTAVSMVAKAVTDPDTIAILGPSNSDAGGATAPIAQRAKVPMVFSQSLGDGILVGDYVFRISGPIDAYYKLAMEHLKSKGVKTVAVLYNTISLRQVQAATEMLPALTKKAGMTIVSSTGVPVTSTDFTAIASKIAEAKPDAVIYFMAGAQQVTGVQQVRRAGYTGLMMGGSSIESSLPAFGQAADGIVWISNFNYLWPNPTVAEFTKAYEAKYAGEHPLGYAAEAYDSVWYVARALKAAGGASREAVQRGLTQVSKAGFDGAQGRISFEGHDARSSGVLMQWTGGKSVLLARGDQ